MLLDKRDNKIVLKEMPTMVIAESVVDAKFTMDFIRKHNTAFLLFEEYMKYRKIKHYYIEDTLVFFKRMEEIVGEHILQKRMEDDDIVQIQKSDAFKA